LLIACKVQIVGISGKALQGYIEKVNSGLLFSHGEFVLKQKQL
jgi:hypothetical protein